jgi:nicotinamidase-related amidase
MPATALDLKTALVVIDLQKGISGYPTIHPFADVVANTRRLAEAFRRARLPVVLVNVSFAADEGDRFRGRTDVPARVFSSPDFADLVPELDAQASDLRITKHQPSAFYGTDLDLQLRRRHVTGIVLTGVATSAGVDTTARAAHERAYNVTFASDAMTDVDPASHTHALTKIFPRLGEIDTTERILALLAGRGA